jgi:hypothetical protein
VLSHQVVAVDDGPISELQWDILGFSGPTTQPHDPELGSSGLFSWNTAGATPGQYIAKTWATDSGLLTPYLNSGRLSVKADLVIQVIPEPATLTMLALALAGMIARVRHRSATHGTRRERLGYWMMQNSGCDARCRVIRMET